MKKILDSIQSKQIWTYMFEKHCSEIPGYEVVVSIMIDNINTLELIYQQLKSLNISDDVNLPDKTYYEIKNLLAQKLELEDQLQVAIAEYATITADADDEDYDDIDNPQLLKMKITNIDNQMFNLVRDYYAD